MRLPYRLQDIARGNARRAHYRVRKALRRTFHIQSYNYTIYTKKSPRRHLGDDVYVFDVTTEEYNDIDEVNISVYR